MKYYKIELVIFTVIFILIFLSNTTGWTNSLIFFGILFGMYQFGRFIQKKIDDRPQ